MPINDPEKRRKYQRERYRAQKAETISIPNLTCKNEFIPLNFRIRSAENVLERIEEQVAIVTNPKDKDGKPIEVCESERIARAKCVGYLLSIALRAIETGGLEAQIQALLDRVAALERGIAA